jgi:hypothetical protein
MLHPSVLRALLDEEVIVVNERLAERAVNAHHDGRYVRVVARELRPDLGTDAERYDAEPVGARGSDPGGRLLSGSEWLAGLCQGQHPVLNRPFVCVRGASGYQTHPLPRIRFVGPLPGSIRLALDLKDAKVGGRGISS